MRSLKIATGTVLACSALLLAAPTAAHAAGAGSPAGCEAAKSQAVEAQADYDAMKKQYDGGDHVNVTKEQLAAGEQNANSTASEAQRLCGDSVANPSASPSTSASPTAPTTQKPRPQHTAPATPVPTAPMKDKPSGAMHTGSGSTSTDPAGVPALAATGGLALAAAAGFALRRRGNRQN
ncbi:hypothetical protein [Streptomyces sp. NPDC050145]|uniref:hypothetical protein n=1 Tax=Streptomyces sp. NPDC050145 TaxID=3365602 RepID=UPI00378AD4D1